MRAEAGAENMKQAWLTKRDRSWENGEGFSRYDGPSDVGVAVLKKEFTGDCRRILIAQDERFGAAEPPEIKIMVKRTQENVLHAAAATSNLSATMVALRKTVAEGRKVARLR